jgi:hypothetical protein
MQRAMSGNVPRRRSARSERRILMIIPVEMAIWLLKNKVASLVCRRAAAPRTRMPWLFRTNERTDCARWYTERGDHQVRIDRGAPSSPTFAHFTSRETQMAFSSGKFQGYDIDRSVVLFSMMNDLTEVPCAISTTAMDDLEGAKRTPAALREEQFMRLRASIEEKAGMKFSNAELEGKPAGIILRSIDFRK